VSKKRKINVPIDSFDMWSLKLLRVLWSKKKTNDWIFQQAN